MQSRFLTAISLGLGVFCASAVTAQAQVYDPDGRFSGGQTSRRYELFGGTSYVGAIKRTSVSAPGNYTPGTIVVNTTERRLYLIQDGGTALKYGIGVGRVGFTWPGTTKVVAKKKWPS